MSEASAAADLVEMTGRVIETAIRHDLEAAMSFYAPDAVSDPSDAALGTFEGVAAIGVFLEDWWGTWRDRLTDVEEAVDLDQGVVFARVWEDGRTAGSDSHVQQRRGRFLLWSRT